MPSRIDTHYRGQCLLADVGGTHTRIALWAEGSQFEHTRVFKNADFSDLEFLLQSYLQELPRVPASLTGSFAVASPVHGDRVRLTNCQWEFSASDLCTSLGLRTLQIINDFTAIALSIPELGAEDTVKIGAGIARAKAPVAVLGPGTGLGVSALIPCSHGWTPLSTEGGHVTLAPACHEETLILDRLRLRLGHVSAEKLLSGPGLLELYRCMTDMQRQQPELDTPEQITKLALLEKNSLANRALEVFLSMLGTIAGNLALTIGARGGVYLAGGILPGMIERILCSCFRERFIAKGRLRDYLDAIPTVLITHPFPALIGLRNYATTSTAD